MKKVYLSIIIIITIICILIGSIIHFSVGPLSTFRENILRNAAGYNNYENSTVTDAFKTLSLDTSVAEVTITEGDEYSYSYTCNHESLVPKFELESGTLSIIQKTSDSFPKFSLGSTAICNIEITVPAGVSLDLLYVKANVGDILIDELTIEKLEVNSDVGALTIDDSDIEDVDLDLDIGDCEINNCRIGGGNIDLEIGDLDLNDIKNFDELSVEVTVDLGDIDVDGGNYTKSYKKSGSTGKLSVTAEIGDVNIN